MQISIEPLITRTRLANVCGWLKDKYGLSWQVAAEALPEIFEDHESPKAQRAMEAMLRIEKLDIRELERAAGGERACRRRRDGCEVTDKSSAVTQPAHGLR